MYSDQIPSAVGVTHLAEPPDLAAFSPGSPVLSILVAVGVQVNALSLFFGLLPCSIIRAHGLSGQPQPLQAVCSNHPGLRGHSKSSMFCTYYVCKGARAALHSLMHSRHMPAAPAPALAAASWGRNSFQSAVWCMQCWCGATLSERTPM